MVRRRLLSALFSPGRPVFALQLDFADSDRLGSPFSSHFEVEGETEKQFFVLVSKEKCMEKCVCTIKEGEGKIKWEGNEKRNDFQKKER